MKIFFFLSAITVLIAITSYNAVAQDETAISLTNQSFSVTDVPKNTTHNRGKSERTIASFQGGRKALAHYFQSTIIYPELARENCIEGTVVVEFSIEADGTIYNPVIIESLGLGCDEVALKSVQQMPKWVPASQNSQHITSRVRINIDFSLQ